MAPSVLFFEAARGSTITEASLLAVLELVGKQGMVLDAVVLWLGLDSGHISAGLPN